MNGEIISADSMQVYRGMDIGTAKPSPEEQKLVPHHMIDVADPSCAYDVATFQRDATRIIGEVAGRGALPILVGGSGLYVRAVLDQLDFPPSAANDGYREELWSVYETEGEAPLRARLGALDPEAEKAITQGNIRRIIRALEVIELTGESYSSRGDQWSSFDSPFNFEMIGIFRERGDLYARINTRVESMVASGLQTEVQALLSLGYRDSLTARQGLGYKELTEALGGNVTIDEAVSRIQKSTRNFAKRQYTWFNRDPRIHWVDVTNLDSPGAFSAVKNHLDGCERMVAVPASDK